MGKSCQAASPNWLDPHEWYYLEAFCNFCVTPYNRSQDMTTTKIAEKYISGLTHKL